VCVCGYRGGEEVPPPSPPQKTERESILLQRLMTTSDDIRDKVQQSRRRLPLLSGCQSRGDEIRMLDAAVILF
jgi:hypothetical protein